MSPWRANIGDVEQANDQAFPATPEELRAHGWQLVEAAIAAAPSASELIIHWFATPQDANVHSDEHFADDARTLKFLSLVVPTLADQLEASMLAVGVPWDLSGARPLMVLLTAIRGEPASFEARELKRLDVRGKPPWWLLGDERLAVPAELAELASRIRL